MGEPPKKDSRHKTVFLTPEEAAEPSKVQPGEPEDHPPGLILPNGEINWNCPCLGGMAIGPCGNSERPFHVSITQRLNPKEVTVWNNSRACRGVCKTILSCLKRPLTRRRTAQRRKNH